MPWWQAVGLERLQGKKVTEESRMMPRYIQQDPQEETAPSNQENLRRANKGIICKSVSGVQFPSGRADYHPQTWTHKRREQFLGPEGESCATRAAKRGAATSVGTTQPEANPARLQGTSQNSQTAVPFVPKTLSYIPTVKKSFLSLLINSIDYQSFKKN